MLLYVSYWSDKLNTHKKIPYDIMMVQLKQMSKEELQRHLQLLGCDWSYEAIYESLKKTFNDLQVADAIFDSCIIQDDNSPYPKDFIDEAVLEIARRETFSFIHYGIVSRDFVQAMQLSDDQQRVDALEMNFRKVLKLAKTFSLDSLEGIVYQVNDGVDIISMLAEMLDTMQQLARQEKPYAKRIVAFVDKYLQIFTKTNTFTKVMLQYEQAQAYLTFNSAKGEQLFLKLLKTHSEPTDVILHYGLAYLDDDEEKTRKIFLRYQNKLDKKSESYDIIMDILQDLERRSS